MRDAGLVQVTEAIYEGARHEVFNETNREEIVGGLLAWLGKVCGMGRAKSASAFEYVTHLW
jgi:hypothetical protein